MGFFSGSPPSWTSRPRGETIPVVSFSTDWEKSRFCCALCIWRSVTVMGVPLGGKRTAAIRFMVKSSGHIPASGLRDQGSLPHRSCSSCGSWWQTVPALTMASTARVVVSAWTACIVGVLERMIPSWGKRVSGRGACIGPNPAAEHRCAFAGASVRAGNDPHAACLPCPAQAGKGVGICRRIWVGYSLALEGGNWYNSALYSEAGRGTLRASRW